VPPIKLLKSGEISEESMHKTVIEWVNLHPMLKGLVLHFPNEGRRTMRFGRLLKTMGMRAGVLDLFVMMGRHGYYGAWIELKSKNGLLSTVQKLFIKDAEAQNYFTTVCFSIEDAIHTIQWYCLENSSQYQKLIMKG
jgi:hypothetical protein